MNRQLPLLASDSARRERTRARCHRALASHARPPLAKQFLVERALCLGFGAIYLSSLAFDVLRMLNR